MNGKYTSYIQKVKDALTPFKAYIKRPAEGHLPYDYIVPEGPYQAQYDWDAFFMIVALSSEISSEAVFLRNWALNYIINAKTNGKVSGCISTVGQDVRYRHMKPFLAQGAYFGGKFLNDYTWLKKYWARMKKVVLYREKYLWSKPYDLGVWYDGYSSGTDNNVAVLKFPNATVVAVDLNTYIYREYRAMSILAKILGRKKDERRFRDRAKAIKKNISEYLWHDKDKIYYNIYSKTREHIKRISFTSFVPLFEKLTPIENGKKTIKKYLLSPDFMWSNYGVRSLAKNDPEYNNGIAIKPFSNFQGPVWPIACYICMHGLINYGFQKEAIILAQKTSRLLLNDIEKTGGMHENYSAETGKPLAAPNKISWNLLAANMLPEALERRNPFVI